MELLARPLDELCAEARALRDEGHGHLVTYSPKVFIPLTKLCRDVCHYCTFAHPPRRGERAYMSIDEVLEVARAGAAAGCREALFTLGDKPELRYRAAREELEALGCETTLDYVAARSRGCARRDRAAAAPQPGRDDARRRCTAAARERVHGADARDDLRPAVRSRRAALRLAGQGSRAQARDARGRGRGARSVHDRAS